jgi:hypothetical protein
MALLQVIGALIGATILVSAIHERLLKLFRA